MSMEAFQSMCMFDKVIASFPLLTCKNLPPNKKCMSIDTHNLEVDPYCDLWKHTSIDTPKIEMTRVL